MKRIRTRFAPSPTGYMHIGNLRTALYAYLFAKSQGGDFILRIEDTDRARYVPDAVEFIERTLAAAKIIPDEGPHHGGNFAPYVQSERMDIYKKYAEQLVESGHAYHEDGAIRQKMPRVGETTFYDVLHGNITIANSELEDQVLLKSDGMPTYNFANVIDDHLMEVSHIIRGTEFITSTPKHVLLYEFFGWELPTFIHLAPVMGKAEDGTVSKLSKRHGATSFNDLIEAGYLPEAITNYVALLGWSPKNSCQEIFSMDELIANFSLDGLSKSPAVFDYAKLDWMSGEYFKAMTDENFAAVADKYLAGYDKIFLASLLKTRVAKLSDIPAMIAFLKELPPFDIELFTNKRNKVTPQKSAEILAPAIKILEQVDLWTLDTLNEKISAFVAESGLKVGAVMWPLRIALSMQKVTPGGVTEILYLLGKETSLDRLNAALEKLQ
ncbi:MAG: glutamate--tRNA ligase [Selenomonadaceae bacterium]|nr:glutamate--tRNA ligase [Selenomonadaceae bacterium]MBQ4403581.1 glutamate--tRNA ligase [Selenomonadaceae bacterium]